MNASHIPIDYGAIAFPSDSLSAGQLRRRGVDVFSAEWAQLDAMLHLEQNCVEIGYRAAVGERECAMSVDGLSAAEIESDLADFYVRFGVAPGFEVAKQQIRELKAAGRREVRNKGQRR